MKFLKIAVLLSIMPISVLATQGNSYECNLKVGDRSIPGVVQFDFTDRQIISFNQDDSNGPIRAQIEIRKKPVLNASVWVSHAPTNDRGADYALTEGVLLKKGSNNLFRMNRFNTQTEVELKCNVQ